MTKSHSLPPTVREFKRDLSVSEKRHLTEKSDTSGLIRLVFLAALLTLTTICIFSGISFWQWLILPQGLLLISLFHLLHECIHDTPFRTKRLNNAVGAVCGFILLLPCEWFRYFHRDHHRYTQIKGKDPELDSPKPVTKAQWVVHVSGIPVFKSLIAVVTRCALGNFKYAYIPEKARQPVITQARQMAVIYVFLLLVSVIVKSSALLWAWILPLVVGQPFLRLYLLAEHTLCEHTDNMFLNTRTVISNPVVRWFTWNMPYHTEHHIYPAVPFHKLPTLHSKVREYLTYKNSSYTEFNQRLYKTLH